MWFSLMELDSPLGQEALACNWPHLSDIFISTSTADSAHIVQNSAIRSQSPVALKWPMSMWFSLLLVH